MAEVPYRWIRRLGKGAMGEVWAADREGRRLAVKILHQRHDDRAIDALRRETRIGPVVAGHPGIVAVREVVEFGGVTYLEMDVVEGPSLDRVLAARLESGRGPLPASIVRRFAVEVLDALGWAAATVSPQDPIRFVHRDVKPGNLLLGPDGKIRLTDFGVARAHAGLGLQETDAGIAKGTPRFMAPELLAERNVDARADQFALGATMFELLSGVPLYEGADLGEILLAALQANVARRLPLVRGPPGLVRVIEKMLAREPFERYASHLEARRALEAVAVPGPSIEDELPEMLAADRVAVADVEPSEITDLGIGLLGAQTMELRANALPTLTGDPATQPSVFDEGAVAVEPDPTDPSDPSVSIEETSRTGPIAEPLPDHALPERLPERIVEVLEPPRRRPTVPSQPPQLEVRPAPTPAPALHADATLERVVLADAPGEATLVLDRPELPFERPRDRARAARHRRDAIRLLATGLLVGLVGGGLLIAVAAVLWSLR